RPTDRPFAARVDSSVAAAAALEAGAVLVSSNHSGISPTDLFPACARAGAAVVVGAPADRFESVRARLVDCAHLAEAAGIPCERIVLEPPLTPTLLPHLRRFAELGYPVLLTVTEPVLAALPVHNHAAAVALAVIDGARLIRTDAVKAATRVCRVVSAILEAR
ncbi:MAG: hypothetical protein M3314_13930, partial [Actinomycetota bacterium]|nr:hypothetical protein [Actinomycetota bacterium]